MKNKDLSQKVMQEIKSREIKMRPRLYFVGGSVLLGLGLAGAIIIAVFFLNLFVFRLRILGPWNYLQFGRPGLRPFLTNFPWTVLLVSVVGIVAGLTLLKRYEFSYKKNFLVLTIVLVTVIGVLGFLLDRVGFNERIAPRRHMRPFYRNYFDNGFRQPLPPQKPRVRSLLKFNSRSEAKTIIQMQGSASTSKQVLI